MFCLLCLACAVLDFALLASYCVGKFLCKEDCAAPKKRFMDDMMSDAGSDDEEM